MKTIFSFLIAFSLIVAACGSDDQPTTTTTTIEACNYEGKPIKLTYTANGDTLDWQEIVQIEVEDYVLVRDPEKWFIAGNVVDHSGLAWEIVTGLRGCFHCNQNPKIIIYEMVEGSWKEVENFYTTGCEPTWKYHLH